MDVDHVFNDLVGTFHFTVYGLGIATIGFDNYLMFKTELYETLRLVNFTTFISTEYGELVSMVIG